MVVVLVLMQREVELLGKVFKVEQERQNGLLVVVVEQLKKVKIHLEMKLEVMEVMDYILVLLVL